MVCYDSVFVFNLNEEQFPALKFKTQCISPIVSWPLQSDAREPFFDLDASENSDHFEDILSIYDGNSNCVDISRIVGSISVCKILENDELISLIVGQNQVWTASVGWHFTASMNLTLLCSLTLFIKYF
jgi:hypothetical protein